MPAEQPNTRRIEELQKQIEQAKAEGRDTAQMQAELDQLQGQGAQTSGRQPQGQGSQNQPSRTGQPQGGQPQSGEKQSR